MTSTPTWGMCVLVLPALLLGGACSSDGASQPQMEGSAAGAGATIGAPCPGGTCPPNYIGSGSASGASGTAGAAGGGGASGAPNGGSGAGTAGSGVGGSVAPGDGGAYGGYITSGSWHGFAWTSTNHPDSMISPTDFAAVTDFPLCASGEVATGQNYVAIIGWNINQDTAAGAAAMEVTPTLGGINVSVTNPGGSPLRVQIQGPTGASNPDDRWCANIPGSGGFIPFDAFNTECWNNNGATYAREPIVAAMVMVPGSDAGPVSFDFCITNLEEANEDGGTVGTGCSLDGSAGEGTGDITGTQTRTVTREGRQYVVQNNVWNADSNNQTLSVNGVSFRVTEQGNGVNGGTPVSYPSVFIGSNYNHATTGSNLPKQVSALTTVPTGWSWSSASGTFNAAYDVWFSTGPGGDYGSPSGGYLMIWFHDPDNIQPLGDPIGPTSVAGRTWNVWVCNNQTGCNQNGVPVISYVATADIPEWSFDLNDFIRNALNDWPGTIQNSWYLSNVFAGFEIWNGGVGLRTNNFCAIVN